METSPETAMFTARDYRFIHEKLALNAGECGNNKRVRPFQLPSIIRKRKKRGTPPVTRVHNDTNRNVIASALTEPDDTDPPPLSDSLVGAPEMGEYSQMTWRAFGDLLNGMDCRELSRCLSGPSTTLWRCPWPWELPDHFQSMYREEILNLYLSMKEQCESCGYPLLQNVTLDAFEDFVVANSRMYK
eukprot:jgi/Mesvir1/8599/Mv05617-RA.1